MIGTLLKNDFGKNKGKNLILLLFIALSAAIAVSVCLMLMQLFSSISGLYETARPPHFLQMHKGELNQRDIDAFNEGYPGMEHWQTVSMVDVHGEELLGKAGETEYLIEAWFTDSSLASAYQTAYEQSQPALPKDGQAVTYTMIFLLSAMTDLMMALVCLLLGAVLLFLAVLCLRYCLLEELEEDAREIGTIKRLEFLPEESAGCIWANCVF